MLKNYFKIAFRNIQKNKLDTFLNLSGLSLGLALSILIIFHIHDELSFDRHFPQADRIFRVTSEMKEGNNMRNWATTSPVMPDYMEQAFPEIKATCRLFVIPEQILSYYPPDNSPRQFKVSSGFFADQTSISMFDFKLISGNAKTALKLVNSIVLTQSIAEKFFPNENPLGKVISISSGSNHKNLLKVTGVIKDLPSNTHFHFSYLVSFPTFYVFLHQIGQDQLAQSKGWAALYNYVLLKDKGQIKSMELRLPDFTASYFQGMGSREEILSNVKFHFQPIVNIHLHSKLEQEFEANSDIVYIYIFSAIALLIMMVAIINFINIVTAQALKRMGEVGIRKVLGASRSQLIGQIISESFLYLFIAIAISVFFIEIFLPYYNSLSGKTYFFGNVFQLVNILLFLGIILLFGLLASIFPAVFISRFNPIRSIKGVRDPLSIAARLRKGLIIFQFAISAFMIFGTLIIHQQLRYFNNKDLGFDKENVIAIQLNNDLRELAVNNPQTLKNELLKNPGISAASVTSNIPGDRLSVEHLRVDGVPDINKHGQFRFIRVDRDYMRVLNLKIIGGKDFSNISENTSAFIISQKVARILQVDNIVGRMASSVFGTKGKIVGVVKDFNFASLHNNIEPLVIEHLPNMHKLHSAFTVYLLVKIKESNIQKCLQTIKTTINKIAPASLFSFTFLDQDLNRLYVSEQHMGNLFNAFALFAIFISCLGLFGLSSYSAQLRMKEIGIRKALGASLINILLLLSKKYILWILIANVIALPLGWIYMNNWLRNFAYQIEIESLPFILTILISTFMAFIAVSYHTLRAANTNPVKSLRYE